MRYLEIVEDQPGLREDGKLRQTLKASASRLISGFDQEELTLTRILAGIGVGDEWIFGLVSRLTHKTISTTPGWTLENPLIPVCIWRRLFR